MTTKFRMSWLAVLAALLLMEGEVFVLQSQETDSSNRQDRGSRDRGSNFRRSRRDQGNWPGSEGNGSSRPSGPPGGWNGARSDRFGSGNTQVRMAALGSETEKSSGTAAKLAEEKPASTVEVSNATNSTETATASKPTENFKPNDPNAFRIISERNIFDHNRRARPRNSGPAPRRIHVDTFSLVGTMSYEKGNYAFFDGSSSQFKMARKPSEKIAGFVVKDISNDVVKLEADGKEFDLKIGMHMRKQDEEEWKLSSSGESGSSSLRRSFNLPDGGTSSTSSGGSQAEAAQESSSASTAGMSEIEIRLMKKREQESAK